MPVKRLTSLKQREVVGKLRQSFISGLSESEIDNIIDNQVTDLASAKGFLKKLSKVVLYLMKKAG